MRELYPMNAQACKKEKVQKRLFADPNYIAEVKWNGYRQLIESGEAFSRIRSNKTEWIPQVTDTLKNLGEYIFDGELLKFPDGKAKDVTSIMQSKLETALEKQKLGGKLTYVAFDLLALKDGTWIGNRPWKERREILEEVFRNEQELKANKYIRLSTVYDYDPEELLKTMVEKGMEGIMLKHINSKWVGAPKGKDSRPANTWYKIKVELNEAEDVVILGFKNPNQFYVDPRTNKPDKTRESKFFTRGWIGGVRIGQMLNGKLVDVGSFSGITDALRKDMSEFPEKYINKVCMIKAFEREADTGRFISPVFKGFRDDKRPEECVWIKEEK